MLNQAVSTTTLLFFFAQIVTFAQGIDIGVHELRTTGTSVMRRTLSDYQDNDLTRQQDDTLLEILKENPSWAFVPIRSSTRNTVNFRPRLGRDEEMVFTETSRSPPFAPRLGRMYPLTPRYGRYTVTSN